MRDSDGSRSCPNMIQEPTQETPEDPGVRRLRYATRDMNGRRCLRG